MGTLYLIWLLANGHTVRKAPCHDMAINHEGCDRIPREIKNTVHLALIRALCRAQVGRVYGPWMMPSGEPKVINPRSPNASPRRRRPAPRPMLSMPMPSPPCLPASYTLLFCGICILHALCSKDHEGCLLTPTAVDTDLANHISQCLLKPA